MEDFFADLYDDGRQNDGGEEPSFSFHDFKKWLSKQKKPEGFDKISESVEQNKKEELRERFKDKIKSRIGRKRKGKD